MQQHKLQVKFVDHKMERIMTIIVQHLDLTNDFRCIYKCFFFYDISYTTVLGKLSEIHNKI